MEITGRVATWMELVVAPEWRLDRTQIKLHPLGGKEDACFALSMDGRWLLAGNGRLTVFHGLDAARRFLSLVRVEHVETGEPLSESVECDNQHYCLRSDPKRGGLTQCKELCRQGGKEAKREPAVMVMH